MLEYLVGAMVGAGVVGFAKVSGFDRDRSFYPTVMIVIAAYYVLFAAMGASKSVFATEILIGFSFSLVAVIGFATKNPWLVAAAILGHGVFDLFHSSLINNPGKPTWWPGFCAAADIVIGGWLAAVTFIKKEKSRAAEA